jgi:hypothetical protein
LEKNMGGLTGFPVVAERPDHGSEKLELADLEPGMMVELVNRDRDGVETTRQLGVLVVGKNFEHPTDPERFSPRRQLFGNDELRRVDDLGSVMMLSQTADVLRQDYGLTTEAFSLYELGLGQLEPGETYDGGWHPHAHLRRSAEPPETLGLQAAMLGAITDAQPTITPSDAGAFTHEYAA